MSLRVSFISEQQQCVVKGVCEEADAAGKVASVSAVLIDCPLLDTNYHRSARFVLVRLIEIPQVLQPWSQKAAEEMCVCVCLDGCVSPGKCFPMVT